MIHRAGPLPASQFDSGASAPPIRESTQPSPHTDVHETFVIDPLDTQPQNRVGAGEAEMAEYEVALVTILASELLLLYPCSITYVAPA